MGDHNLKPALKHISYLPNHTIKKTSLCDTKVSRSRSHVCDDNFTNVHVF